MGEDGITYTKIEVLVWVCVEKEVEVVLDGWLEVEVAEAVLDVPEVWVELPPGEVVVDVEVSVEDVVVSEVVVSEVVVVGVEDVVVVGVEVVVTESDVPVEVVRLVLV